MKTQSKEDESDEFKVYARIRPLSEKEFSSDSNIKIAPQGCLKCESNTIIISDPISSEFYSRKEKHFAFDEVFDENSDNRKIFNKIIKKLVDKTLMGYNSSALAYGVTGTGKTHTMFGDIRYRLDNLGEQEKTYFKDLKNIDYNLEFDSIAINFEDSSKKNKYEKFSSGNKFIYPSDTNVFLSGNSGNYQVNHNNNSNNFGICIYAVDYLFKRINELKSTSKPHQQNFNSAGNILKLEDIVNNQDIKNKSYKDIDTIKTDIDREGIDFKSYSINLTYLEIYNEQVIDLLSENKEKSEPLLILEDPVKGICIPDITQYKINDVSQVINLILLGNSRRTMAPTSGNQFSSRSHALLEFTIDQINLKKETSVTSKLCLVDLAGSERGSLEKGARREEGANINKSLLALGNCINILSDKSRRNNFVPYRDSKLTRLLKDSLGGNISTIMIACVSANVTTFEETLNTLKYASRARKIQKVVSKNVQDNINNADLNGYKNVIENLRNEVYQLKDIIRNQNFLLNKNLEIKGECTSFELFQDNLNIKKDSGKNETLTEARYSLNKLSSKELKFNSVNIPESYNSNKIDKDVNFNIVEIDEFNKKQVDCLENDENYLLRKEKGVDNEENLNKINSKKEKLKEKFLNEDKYMKFLNKIQRLNYEKILFENIQGKNIDGSFENFEKDKNYLSLKKYLEIYFKVLVDSIYENSSEYFKIQTKINKIKEKKGLNESIITKFSMHKEKGESSSNKKESLNQFIDLENNKNISKEINLFNNKKSENLLYLEEDKIEKGEIDIKKDSEVMIDEIDKNGKLLKFTSEKKIQKNPKQEDINEKLANKLQILNNNLDENLLFKKKLEEFVVNFLSNTKYKGFIETKNYLIDLQRKKLNYENEIKNLHLQIQKLKAANEEKEEHFNNIKDLELVKKPINKIREKQSVLKYSSYGEIYNSKLQIEKLNKSFSKKKSKFLIKLYNMKEKNVDFMSNNLEQKSDIYSKYNKTLKSNKQNFNKKINFSDEKYFSSDNNIANIKNLKYEMNEENLKQELKYSSYKDDEDGKQKYHSIEKDEKKSSLINHKKNKSAINTNLSNKLNNLVNSKPLISQHKRNVSKGKINFLKMKKQINSILHFSNNRVKRIAYSNDFDKDLLCDLKPNHTKNQSKIEPKIIVSNPNDNMLLKQNNFIYNRKSSPKQKETSPKLKPSSQINYIDLGNDMKIPIVTASLEESIYDEKIQTQGNNFLKNVENMKKNKNISIKGNKSKSSHQIKQISISNDDRNKSNSKNNNMAQEDIDTNFNNLNKKVYSKILQEKPKNVLIDLGANNKEEEEINENLIIKNIIQKKQKNKKNLNCIKESAKNLKFDMLTEDKKEKSKKSSPSISHKQKNTIDMNQEIEINLRNVKEIFDKNYIKNNLNQMSKKEINKTNKNPLNNLNNLNKFSTQKTKGIFKEKNEVNNRINNMLNSITNSQKEKINRKASTKFAVSVGNVLSSKYLMSDNCGNLNEKDSFDGPNQYFNGSKNLMSKNTGSVNIIKSERNRYETKNGYRANSDLIEYKKDVNDYLELMIGNTNEILNKINYNEKKKDNESVIPQHKIDLNFNGNLPNNNADAISNAKLESLRKSCGYKDARKSLNYNTNQCDNIPNKLLNLEDNINNNKNHDKNLILDSDNIIRKNELWDEINKNLDIKNGLIEMKNNNLLDLNKIESIELNSFLDTEQKTNNYSKKSSNICNFPNPYLMNTNKFLNINRASSANLDEKEKSNTSLVISAVTNNNDLFLNSSELDLIQNVFNIGNTSSKTNKFQYDYLFEDNNNKNIGFKDNNLSLMNKYNSLKNFKDKKNLIDIRSDEKENFKYTLYKNLIENKDLQIDFGMESIKKDTSRAFEEALIKFKEITNENNKN